MNIVTRLIASLVLLALWFWLAFSLDTTATLGTAAAAGHQFDDSNAAFVGAVTRLRLFSWLGGVLTLVMLAGLVLIWRAPVMRALRGGRIDRPRLLAIVLLPLLAFAHQAAAYYDKSDYTEAYFILPNESAFFIPDTGANKEGQAKFGSAEYLEANKVPAKRFIIPHARFAGSGSLFSDYYVPTGRLIVVDRTPYNREWTASNARGTSAKNESFPCQSTEGLNITVEISIATSVTEDNAAKFLYWFGVKPPVGDRRDPQVIFTSVYYGRSLAEVMDSVGRGKVQALVCHEIGARKFDQVNQEQNAIITAVEKNTSDFLISRGITLDYIGFAGTFTFDRDVQQAVNDRYTAEKIGPVLPILQTKALLDATARWNGQLPANVSGLWLLPADLLDAARAWLSATQPAGKGP